MRMCAISNKTRRSRRRRRRVVVIEKGNEKIKDGTRTAALKTMVKDILYRSRMTFWMSSTSPDHVITTPDSAPEKRTDRPNPVEQRESTEISSLRADSRSVPRAGISLTSTTKPKYERLRIQSNHHIITKTEIHGGKRREQARRRRQSPEERLREG